jgi:hypothetical protein
MYERLGSDDAVDPLNLQGVARLRGIYQAGRRMWSIRGQGWLIH